MLGANPLASNGSLATAPDWPGRIEALRARGGKLVVVDPRRSRTPRRPTSGSPCAPAATRSCSPPWCACPARRGARRPRRRRRRTSRASTRLGPALATFGPDDGRRGHRRRCRDDPPARSRAGAAPRAAVYGRIGTTTAEFGTVASWLVDVLNICTGNLDRPGGAMFTTPAVAGANTRGTPRPGVACAQPSALAGRDLPGTFGELPAVCLAEEIETPGRRADPGAGVRRRQPGAVAAQRRTPRRRLGALELMVSVDIYLNETSRHADVILPAPSALEKPHYDVALLQLAVRNVANWSDPRAAARPTASPTSGRSSPASPSSPRALGGPNFGGDPAVVDDLVIGRSSAPRSPTSTARCTAAPPTSCSPPSPRARAGADHRLLSAQRPVRRPLRRRPGRAHPRRPDRRPARRRPRPAPATLPDGLRTPTGMIDVAPQPILDDLPRMAAASHAPSDGASAHRPPRPALQQLVDAQRRGARQGQAALRAHVHPDDASSIGPGPTAGRPR